MTIFKYIYSLIYSDFMTVYHDSKDVKRMRETAHYQPLASPYLDKGQKKRYFWSKKFFVKNKMKSMILMGQKHFYLNIQFGGLT